MEGELGSGARIAIALIVIGVIISVIFVILGFTRGTTNQGISKVQSSMDSMSLAEFDDYDQKLMSGTQVVSAIKLFEGRPVATVTRTTAQMDTTKGGEANTGFNYGALLDDTDGNYVTEPLTKGDSEAWYESSLEISTSGTLTFNMNYKPLTKTATNTFVRPTGLFLAELIKDSTGTIIGICFTQQ